LLSTLPQIGRNDIIGLLSPVFDASHLVEINAFVFDQIRAPKQAAKLA
jgi:hypothetical protein